MPRPETAAPVPPEIKEEKIRTCETRRWRCHEHAKSKFSYLDRGATLLPSIGVEKGGLAAGRRVPDDLQSPASLTAGDCPSVCSVLRRRHSHRASVLRRALMALGASHTCALGGVGSRP